MATATFGRRNAIEPARALRSAEVAAPRRIDAGPSGGEAAPRAADAARATLPGSTRKVVVGALALLLMAVALPAAYFSELRRDAALAGTFRPDFSVRVERASCSRYLFLVTSCSVQLSWPDGNARRIAESSFLVGLKSMGGLRVVPVRSSTDATIVTSAVALDHLSNRAWTLAVVSGACLLLSILSLISLRRRGT